jgi:hypothetical protein
VLEATLEGTPDALLVAAALDVEATDPAADVAAALVVSAALEVAALLALVAAAELESE